MNNNDFLHRILERKRREIQAASVKISEKNLRRMAEDGRGRRPFLETLATPETGGPAIIAEIKRASPSKGVIREDLDPKQTARDYARGGAAAISVLTDADDFHGSPADLEQARAAVSLPVLRKDFIISTYQIYESAVMGADAILLIVRALSPSFLTDALALCRVLGMDALVEVHSETELETASRAGTRLVGINNRDLTTFRTDIGNCIRIGRGLDRGQVAVAESGIRDRKDVETLLGAGIRNFLIGESLVRADDPQRFLAHLLGKGYRP